MYYLDTNICVYFLKGKYPQVMEKIKKVKLPAASRGAS